MLPEPNFPVRPGEFVGRNREIEAFRLALKQGLSTGRTGSFAVLGDWGIGKSSLLLKFASMCAEPACAMLPVFVSASKDIHDYLRLAESLLDKFAEAISTAPNLQARLRTELGNWRVQRISLGGLGLERDSPRFFLSSGSSLLRHALTEAWGRFVKAARMNGAIFFLDDLQNITSISKGDLALMLRDQFQSFGVEGMNYGVCFSAKADYFADAKGLAEPAIRFYTKLYLGPFTHEEIFEYTRSTFHVLAGEPDVLASWLHQKTLGHPYFVAFICRHLAKSLDSRHPQKLEEAWPTIFEQLGREKFRSDVSQLSAKEIDLLREIARRPDEPALSQMGPQFKREYFRRLTERGLLVRTRRGEYRLYHPLFRSFLQQAK